MAAETKKRYLKVNDWILGDVIGQGNDAVVRAAVNQSTNVKAAAKIISTRDLALKEGKDKSGVRSRIRRESDILSYVNHPHIVALYETLWHGDDVYLIMEYVGGGELINFIDNEGVHEEDAKFVFWQILSAVHYCHLRQIVHRDLKLENLLVDSQTNKIKIADFGFANMLKIDQKKFETICGTVLYLAPEVFLGQEYSGPPVDIWSLGVILFAMLCGRFPFGDTENIARHVVSGQYTIPDFISKPAAKLLKKILCTDPKKRATFKDIVKSDWLKQTVKEHIELMPSEVVEVDKRNPATMKVYRRLTGLRASDDGVSEREDEVVERREKEEEREKLERIQKKDSGEEEDREEDKEKEKSGRDRTLSRSSSRKKLGRTLSRSLNAFTEKSAVSSSNRQERGKERKKVTELEKEEEKKNKKKKQEEEKKVEKESGKKKKEESKRKSSMNSSAYFRNQESTKDLKFTSV